MHDLPNFVRELGNSGDSLFVVDHRRRVVLWNQAAESTYGHQPSDVLGRPCYEVIAGRTHTGERWCGPECSVQLSLRECRPHDGFSLWFRDKIGNERCASVSIIELHSSGKPLTVHLLRDEKCSECDQKKLSRIQDIMRTVAYTGSPEVTSRRDRKVKARAKGMSNLTPREVEILTLVAQGLASKNIAERLHLSTYTVRNHIQNALQKLGLHTKAQAVSYAYKVGLL